VEAGLRLEASGVSCCAVGVVGAPMCVAAPGIYVFHAYQANDSAQWKRKVQADKRVMTKQPYRLYALWLKVTQIKVLQIKEHSSNPREITAIKKITSLNTRFYTLGNHQKIPKTTVNSLYTLGPN